jgi:hypothetical protein
MHRERTYATDDSYFVLAAVFASATSAVAFERMADREPRMRMSTQSPGALWPVPDGGHIRHTDKSPEQIGSISGRMSPLSTARCTSA